MTNKPKERPPEDSLKKLADFTERILRVPKHELPGSEHSGPKKIDEPCPEG